MRFIFTLFFLTIFSYANENIINMKNCERFELSKYTLLISCHKLDYLVEYKYNDDIEKDNIKKITAITQKEEKIILLNVGN